MDAEYVTRSELLEYATIIHSIQEELGWLKSDYSIALGTPDVCGNGGVGGVIGERIKQMECEISQIKSALIDIQDSLRRLGMDDMSQRLGDLKMLLA